MQKEDHHQSVNFVSNYVCNQKAYEDNLAFNLEGEVPKSEFIKCVERVCFFIFKCFVCIGDIKVYGKCVERV